MKNFKIIFLGLVAISMVGCSSGGSGVNDVKPTINRSITIINTKSGKVTNKDGKDNANTITVDGNNTIGMRVDDKHSGELTNSGTINIKNKTSIGMVARDQNNSATNSGTINIESKYSFGMYGNGEKATIKNTKTINLNKNDQVGMYVQNGSHALNTGTINLNDSNGVGMWAEGKDSTITNNGTITLRGTGTDIGPGTQPSSGGELGKDNHGNIGMKATDGGRIINKGHITFSNK